MGQPVVKAFLLSLLVSLVFLGISARAVRRQLLREQAAIMWLAVSLAMVALSATLPFHLLNHLAALVGIIYPPDLILLLAVLFLVLLVFQLSIVFARLNANHTRLAQELGLLMAKLEEEQKSVANADRTQASIPDEVGQATLPGL